jgi:hypothetical protein
VFSVIRRNYVRVSHFCFNSAARPRLNFVVERNLNVHCDLPKGEIWTYFVLWMSGVLYSVHNDYFSDISECSHA